MTEIIFHHGVADRLGYVCRLLRAATAQGVRAVVTGDAATLQALDERLWTFSDAEFVAHCHAHAQPQMVDLSAVILAPNLEGIAARPVLVQLHSGIAPGFERFERVSEIVGLEPDDRIAGRTRLKHYKDRGYPITLRDAGAGG